MLIKQRLAFSLVVILGLAGGALIPAAAAPPEVVRFQGTITTIQGAPAPDGDYVLHPIVYDAAVAGAVVYDHGETPVLVVGGAYTLDLSPANPGDLAAAFSEGPRFLEIIVKEVNGGMVDEVLVPRQEIASVPFALNSSGGGLPTGTILAFGGLTAPEGWRICDGSEVGRTELADLFAVVGTTFGAGDGSTTFNLPALHGRVPFGLDASDTDFDVLGKTGGVQSHKHSMGQPDNVTNVNAGAQGGNYLARGNHRHGVNNTKALPPYQVVHWIIKE